MQKRTVVLLPFLTLIVACGGTGAPSDREAPVIRNLYPTVFKGNLQMDGSIMVAFSEEMNPASLQAAVKLQDSTGATVPATVTTGSSSASIKPSSALKSSTSYTLVVTREAKDLAGNQLAAESRTAYMTEATPYTIRLNHFTASRYDTATVTATFTYTGTEEAGSIWVRASCSEDGYSYLSTSLATAATPSKWTPGQTQNIFLRHSGGYPYFTDNTVRCRFSSDDSANTRRVIVN
ncbi:Ig-like domain-containing protein [Deinococcus deserti]|uniref:SbsA Ig-like domain-containing protein n=1 Tax=Deinococcus deserti (strain DSM 17065 / CIP 109153 / LMG 22923 / VCD115) TaxID=546414 RepID=C1CVL7_DEIDV|nr:Ig-like domain-containing protein [Deinococcus deserti]ACO46234.1 Hypothetical protein, precursor [Deinococcus deserti VCD115]